MVFCYVENVGTFQILPFSENWLFLMVKIPLYDPLSRKIKQANKTKFNF